MINLTKYTQSRWLKGADLPKGRATTVTIKDIFEYTFDQTQETKPVLSFSDYDQNLVLNKTQVLVLVDMFSDDTRLWIGQRINLRQTPSAFPGKPTIEISEAPPAFGSQTTQVEDEDREDVPV